MGSNLNQSRRRAPSKAGRRASTLFKLLLLVGVLVAAGTALTPLLRTTESAKPPQLTVRYRTDPTATTAVATPWFEVINTSEKAVSLDRVTLRYYFTADGSSSYAFNCVQAAFGCSNIGGTFTALADPAKDADRYLQLSFTAGAGSLAPGQNSRGIQLQIYRTDHKNLTQADDYSFNPADTTFKPSVQVAAYIDGALVWGNEPGGPAEAPAQAASAPSPKPAAAAGIMFDDFHYSGAKDPALFDHGWLIRTSSGGPGIQDTWSAAGVSFPSDTSAQGGQALQLRASTDGTRAGTTQAELTSTSQTFFTGTYAARIYFTDKPATGHNGDHINESFYAISPYNSLYSELDNEYMPNGGWGAAGPILDTTSWYSATNGDRVTKRNHDSIAGWHTLMITAAHGVVTYSIDGHKLFSSDGKYFPREGMAVNFNTWFVDLPLLGQRSWNMRINWFYYNAKQSMSLAQIQTAVNGFYSSGTNYVDTMVKH